MGAPLPFVRPSRPSAKDSPLARRLKCAVAASDLRNMKRLEEAAGLPYGSVVVFSNGPLRQSPERRLAVMQAVEAQLGIPVAEVAALAGILPDGTAPGAPASGGIEGLSERQAPAANAFRSLVGRRPWPGLTPDRPTWFTWGDDLRRAWLALRASDAPFAAAHPRAQLPSFTTWRIVIDGDRPGFALVSGGDEDLAALERLALAAGLDALAGLMVPVADPAPGEPETPANPPIPQVGGNDSPEPANLQQGIAIPETAEIPAIQENQGDRAGLSKSGDTPPHSGAGLLKSEHTPRHGVAGVPATVAKNPVAKPMQGEARQ